MTDCTTHPETCRVIGNSDPGVMLLLLALLFIVVLLWEPVAAILERLKK